MLKVASSVKDVDDAIKDIILSFGKIEFKMILFFCSIKYNPELIAKKMKESFPSSEVMGCTTAGEFANGASLTNSIVAMGLDDTIIKKVSVRVCDYKQNVEPIIPELLIQMGKEMDINIENADITKYVGVLLNDGLSGKEEQIMDIIGNQTNIFFAGGSAGDDFRFDKTHVFYNGNAYSESSLLILLEVTNGYQIIQTHGLKVTNKALTVTKADFNKRLIYEFNGKPAIKEYARILGVDIFEAERLFHSHPLAVVYNNVAYVRTPQKLGTNGSMYFYSGLRENMEVTLMKESAIIEHAAYSMEFAKKSLGKIAALLDFDCSSRFSVLERDRLFSKYEKVFHGIPSIGFYTYGEQHIGQHNQTAIMIAFK